ncbi:hypothetical protein M0657_009873 [Pyricularia oryzae]|nr:hypothetical protein M0657_009873 [Pyricularia oryzae]KAI7918437.1 hypothetical protein M9X92_006915 [Pyricularia oryzae]
MNSFGRLGSCRNVPPRFTPNGTGAAFCGAIRTRPGLGLLAVVVLCPHSTMLFKLLPGDSSSKSRSAAHVPLNSICFLTETAGRSADPLQILCGGH